MRSTRRQTPSASRVTSAFRKSKLALAALASLLSAFALATPAHATRIKAACALTGEAKALDKDDPTLGVRLVGGKGSFTFSSLAIACVGVKDGVPDAQLLQTTTSGAFENVVCGTGKVVGTITSLAAPLKYQNVVKGKKFSIHYLNRDGLFFWHDSAKPSVLFDPKDEVLDGLTRPAERKALDVKDWHLAGQTRVDEATQKLDDEPDPLRNHCMKALTISGFIAIDEDDGQGPIEKFP